MANDPQLREGQFPSKYTVPVSVEEAKLRAEHVRNGCLYYHGSPPPQAGLFDRWAEVDLPMCIAEENSRALIAATQSMKWATWMVAVVTFISAVSTAVMAFLALRGK